MAGLRIDVCLPKPRFVHLSGPTRHPIAPEVKTTEGKSALPAWTRIYDNIYMTRESKGIKQNNMVV
jgi:hypothetical protein